MAAVSITPANVQQSSQARVKTGTAGGTITAGMVVYADATDNGHIKPADADAAASANIVGIALNGASDGQPVSYTDYDPDFTVGGTVAAGTIYCCGITTPGDLVPESDLGTGDYLSVVGVGISATKMFVKLMVTGATHV